MELLQLVLNQNELMSSVFADRDEYSNHTKNKRAIILKSTLQIQGYLIVLMQPEY